MFNCLFLISLVLFFITGIGHSMAKKLQTNNISSVTDLLSCPNQVLEKEFGNTLAVLMIKLCHGIDDSKVTPSGEFKSISDEDSFKKCSTLDDARKRLKSLIEGLLPRVSCDVGVPQTVRVTVRRQEDKFYKRESRQCGLPHTISFADKDKAGDVLLEVCLSLFNKVVNAKKPFHLTLLGISLTNFHKPFPAQSKNISNFFQKSCSKQTGATSTCSNPVTPSKNDCLGERKCPAALLSNGNDELSDQNSNDNNNIHIKGQEQQESSGLTGQSTQQNQTVIVGLNNELNEPTLICPNGVDPTVFAELPSELQRELRAHWHIQDKRTVTTDDKVATKTKKCSGIQRYFARAQGSQASRMFK